MTDGPAVVLGAGPGGTGLVDRLVSSGGKVRVVTRSASDGLRIG